MDIRELFVENSRGQGQRKTTLCLSFFPRIYPSFSSFFSSFSFFLFSPSLGERNSFERVISFLFEKCAVFREFEHYRVVHKGKKGEKKRDWETRLFTWTGDTKEFGAVSVCYRLMSFASIWLQTLGNKGEVPRSWGSFYFGRKGNDRAEKNFFCI